MKPSTTSGAATDGERKAAWTAERNIPYETPEARSGPSTNLACLDLFFSGKQLGKRVVVYVHGGGWIGGDKSEVEEYPRLLDFFVRRDCIVASVNFSLTRKSRGGMVTYQDQASDIAAAIKWLAAHAHEYGGTPEGFILLGYSSGAHLAALVALDERYLASQGIAGDLVRCVIALDVHTYDIPAALALMKGTPLEANIPLLTSLFGETRAEQEAASPSSYLTNAGKKAFLLFSCSLSGRRHQTVSRKTSEAFKEKLIAHGHAALHEHLEHDGHRSILSRFGSRFDGVSEKIKVFLDVEAGAHWGLQNGRKGQASQQPCRELKLEAVRVAEISDRSVAEIAEGFGVRIGEIYAWKKEFKKQGKLSAALRGEISGSGPLTEAANAKTAGAEFRKEFKQEAVRLLQSSGRTAIQIAREFGVRVGQIYAWEKEFKKQGKSSAALRRETTDPDPLTGAAESKNESEEFKQEAVRLLQSSGRTAIQIAREFGVRVREIYAWEKEFKKQGKLSAPLRRETSGPDPVTGAASPKIGGAEYSEEFKLQAVRLCEESGQTPTRLARELDISLVNLYQWRKEYSGRP